MADEWIRDVAGDFLDFEAAAWAACLDDHSRPQRNGNALEDFLGPSSGKGSALVLYVTHVREERTVKTRRRRELPAEAAAAAAPPAAQAQRHGWSV